MLRLEPHGLSLRRDVLEDPERDLWTAMGPRVADSEQLADRLGAALDRVESLLGGDAA